MLSALGKRKQANTDSLMRSLWIAELKMSARGCDWILSGLIK
jgi:hypothetical protein